MPYHALTHVSGAILCLALAVILVFTHLSIRGLRAHRAAEAAAAARGTATTLWALGFSLPTLLRASSVACCFSALTCCTLALIANYLFVDLVRDYGLRYVSPIESPSGLGFSRAGQFCMFVAKLGPGGYAITKGFSYVFFFFKARLVRPTEKMSWAHKGLLFVTLQLFGFGACGVWLIQGDANRLDATCGFHVPPWMVILMGAADIVLSSMYAVLFIAPLRETIKANRAMRSGAARVAPVLRVKVTPADAAITAAASAAADAGSQALAAASARGSALEKVMRRNLQSCVLSMLSTAAAMSVIVVSHLLDDASLRKVSLAIGTLDLAVTSMAIAHLMHKSTKPDASSSASAGLTAGRDRTTQVPKVSAPATSATTMVAAGGSTLSGAPASVGNSGRRSSGGVDLAAAASPAAPTPLHNGFMRPAPTSPSNPHSAVELTQPSQQP